MIIEELSDYAKWIRTIITYHKNILKTGDFRLSIVMRNGVHELNTIDHEDISNDKGVQTML